MIQYSDTSHAESKASLGHHVLTIQNVDAPTAAALRGLAAAQSCEVINAQGGQFVVSGIVQDLIAFARGLKMGECDKMNLTDSLARASERAGTDRLGLQIMAARRGKVQL